jgi:hypothetical protein
MSAHTRARICTKTLLRSIRYLAATQYVIELRQVGRAEVIARLDMLKAVDGYPRLARGTLRHSRPAIAPTGCQYVAFLWKVQ